MTSKSSPPILIVGAGPTGLVLALRLARHGVPVRIIDQKSGPGEASRAMVVQARALEHYGQIGLAAAMVQQGIAIEQLHLREGNREVTAVGIKDIGGDLSPFPFVLSFPQDDHERFLVEQLAAQGITVEWGVALKTFAETGSGVATVLVRGDDEERFEASYVCGCDGAHSTVRRVLELDFAGGTYSELFYVADVGITTAFAPDLFVNLSAQGFVLMLPVRSRGMQRLIGIVPPDLAGREHLTFADVRASAEAAIDVQVDQVNWFSTYHVHHRVADRFRVGRSFLLGDAAHVHSPAGGQGMNTGIGDAVNLSWKLAQVVAGRIGPAVLDTYEPERIAFARTLVATTDRAFQGITGQGWGGHLLRHRLVPMLAPILLGRKSVQRALFRAISQIRIAYRDSALSAGQAGRLHGGDRLPWVPSASGDNFRALDNLDWRLHVYGVPSQAMSEEATALGLPMDSFPWNAAADRAGLHQDAMYLIRPDMHVALASMKQDPRTLRTFATRIGLAATLPVHAAERTGSMRGRSRRAASARISICTGASIWCTPGP